MRQDARLSALVANQVHLTSAIGLVDALHNGWTSALHLLPSEEVQSELAARRQLQTRWSLLSLYTYPLKTREVVVG